MKCNECGAIFDQPDRVRERLDDEYGYEDYYVCPGCGSTDFEETVKCLNCGEESEQQICDQCVEMLSDDETVLKYSSDRRENIELGSLFLYNFTQGEIEEILLRELNNSGKWDELKDDFIKSDYSDFIDWMEEEINA